MSLKAFSQNELKVAPRSFINDVAL
jgi:hypothetical protein